MKTYKITFSQEFGPVNPVKVTGVISIEDNYYILRNGASSIFGEQPSLIFSAHATRVLHIMEVPNEG